jgi:hypothetical protein
MILVRARIVSLFALVWRGAIILLLMALAAVIVGLPPELPSLPPSSPSSVAPPFQEPPAPQIPDYPAILERPLFDPSRRPWTAAPSAVDVVPKVEAVPFPEYTLVAVVITGDSRRAVLQRPNSDKSITLSIGQQLEGWTARDIAIDRVQFEAAGNSHYLRFVTPKEHR